MDDGLPTRHDFLGPHGGCLDAQEAWRNFGGLTLEEADSKFGEAPEVYQEDFMFMGTPAFTFYFPVIDRFVREQAKSCESGSHDEFWIIASGITTRFPDLTQEIPDKVNQAVVALCDFVLEHLKEMDFEAVDCSRSLDELVSAWTHLQQALASV